MYGPQGLDRETEIEIDARKKIENRMNLENQMLQNALVKRELSRKQKEEDMIDIEGVDQALRQEQFLRETQLKASQELMRAAWNEQISKNEHARQVQQIFK